MPEVPVLVAGCGPPNGAYDADVVILTMGRVAETVAAVKSARLQERVSCYVAVLDQGSGAAGREVFRNAFAGVDRVGYFVSAVNLGVGGGRNWLASVGHGEVIIGLDNDAVFADGLVVLGAVRALRAAPGLGVVGFRILDAAGAELDERSWGYPVGLKGFAGGGFLATTFVGAGHAIRRACWEDVGGYDASLFFTWEEYDFSLRAIALGWEVAYRGGLAVRHCLAAEGRVRWQGGRTRLFVRNRLVIARKWGAPWGLLAPRIAGYLMKGALNGQAWGAMCGVAGAVARDSGVERRRMTAAMRDYVYRHETRHRGGVIQRLWTEVFGRLTDAAGRASG
jgi:GT2 family glycosyltransferase